MWQLFSLLIFTYWCRGVSLHKILETKNCDKSHGVTLPSLNVRLSNTITNHCLQFSSQKKSSVQTNCNFRPIIRPNSQPRGAHAEFVWRLRVWLLRATAKHLLTTLSLVDDHFQALACPRNCLSGWSPRSPPPQTQASWPAGRRQWWGWECRQSSSPSVDPLLLHCPPIASSQPWCYIWVKELLIYDCQLIFKNSTCILACCPFFWPSLVRTDSTKVQTLRTDPFELWKGQIM